MLCFHNCAVFLKAKILLDLLKLVLSLSPPFLLDVLIGKFISLCQKDSYYSCNVRNKVFC